MEDRGTAVVCLTVGMELSAQLRPNLEQGSWGQMESCTRTSGEHKPLKEETSC